MGFWRIKRYLLWIRCQIRSCQSELFYWKRIYLFGACKNVVLLTRTRSKNCQNYPNETIFFTDVTLYNFLMTIIFFNFSNYSIKKWKNTKSFLIDKDYEKIKEFDKQTLFSNIYYFWCFHHFFLVLHLERDRSHKTGEKYKKKVGGRFGIC